VTDACGIDNESTEVAGVDRFVVGCTAAGVFHVWMLTAFSRTFVDGDTRPRPGSGSGMMLW
jgi:hypothetical protein